MNVISFTNNIAVTINILYSYDIFTNSHVNINTFRNYIANELQELFLISYKKIMCVYVFSKIFLI